MIHLVKNEIIESEELLQNFKELLPVMKSCSNDDWGPDLRFMGVKLM